MSSSFCIGKPFIELQQVESTNNYATGLIHAGMAQPGSAVFAHHQTKGKGQRHKEWQSEAGKNIALSIIVNPIHLFFGQSFLLSMAAAVATQRFCQDHLGDETKIKWPNDIYWRDRKTAGILIENILQGTTWKWAVVGIGININQTVFDEMASKAVSFKQITGREFNPVDLAKELCGFVEDAYHELLQSSATIRAAYKQNLYKLNQNVVLKKEARTFTALLKDVKTNGQLIVETSVEEEFSVGEVEWVFSS